MQFLDQPITARLSLHSPSLGNAMMMMSESPAPDLIDHPAVPVVTPPPDPAQIAILAALAALHNEIADLRADLHARTWLARFRRLWHRLSSWRIR